MADLADGVFVDALDINPITFDTGDLKWSARRTAASGWLKCDGSAVSRTTYATLFGVLAPSLGTVTVTIASPGVFTKVAHGLVIGDGVYLTTTGAVPTGLAVNTQYYVVSTPTADTFTLSATRGGSAINTSGTQSGVHTLHWCPWGLGDGTATFNVPDFAGRMIAATSGSSGHVDVGAVGANDGITLAFRRPKHQHKLTFGTGSGGAVAAPQTGAGFSGTNSLTGFVGADTTHDSVDAPAYATANLFIKT